MSTAETSKILLVGATGLIGSHILAQAGSRELGILVRKPVTGLPATVRDYVCENSDDWPKRITAIKPDTLICCIGTTMKKAGGEVQFRAVDQHLVLACAGYARKSGARYMIIVSSVGASERVDNVYLNTKGVVERELTEMAFDRLDILRPSLLLGDRGESRSAEGIGKLMAPLFNPLLLGSTRKYRAIQAETVASAILKLSRETAPGRFVHHYDQIVALAR